LEENIEQKIDDSHNQLELILNVLGTPTIDEFYAITSRRSKEYIRSLAFRKKIPFRELYPKASKEVIDFLDHTLTCKSLLLPSLYSLLLHPDCTVTRQTPSPLRLSLRAIDPLPTQLPPESANNQSTQERGSP